MVSVYVIENLVNGKCYVGITSRSPEQRLAEHVSRANNGDRNNRLSLAIRKYGASNFRAFVEQTFADDLAARIYEGAIIRKYDSCVNGYNSNYGGHGNLFITDETKQKISAAQKGKYIPSEQRAKMSAAKLGRKECANNFGAYAQKGHGINVNAGQYEVELPDGSVEVIVNMTRFCKAHGLSDSERGGLCKGRRVAGYKVLRRLDGHSERKYSQVGGSGGYPTLDIDMSDFE